ncbi:MAG: glutamine-hydrolyzing carbamoyl-phosphate synthase small subunit [Phycisphaerae bacterium]
MRPNSSPATCLLALEDGTVFQGQAFGARGTQTGEAVFNTSMTGYQEILTDPSYCGQIVTMTCPLIGNYGVNAQDVESSWPHLHGFVVKELAGRYSNQRAATGLAEYLAEHDVIGVQGVDTRALTLRLRERGSMRSVITTEVSEPLQCVELARQAPSMAGADLVRNVAQRDACRWTTGFEDAFSARRNPQQDGSVERLPVVAIDCGMKRNILRHLVDVGCDVWIVPPTASMETILERNPRGVFVSNGPGDPAAVSYAIELLARLIGKVPLFGICLGHQLLGLALGATTIKLKFGHRGANQPVQNLLTSEVEITSQNHGFAIDRASLADVGCTVTHVNLNDDTVEGFAHQKWPVFAVQYHPEASPGPHDAGYLFDVFRRMMETGRPITASTMAAGAVPGRIQEGAQPTTTR